MECLLTPLDHEILLRERWLAQTWLPVVNRGLTYDDRDRSLVCLADLLSTHDLNSWVEFLTGVYRSFAS